MLRFTNKTRSSIIDQLISFQNNWFRNSEISADRLNTVSAPIPYTQCTVNSHVTKRAHPSRYRLALECQNLLYRILSISFIVSNNPRVFLYIWNHQICWQYQGFVIHFRFTADQKFYPRNFFISASNAPLNFSRGPLKHFWHSSLASTLKMHFRGFWHWSAKRNRDC